MPNDDATAQAGPPPPSYEDAEDPTVELLARRLARLEARVHGTTATTDASAPAGGMLLMPLGGRDPDLRGRLQAVAARVAEAGHRVGEAGARQQLEREMLLPSSSSASASDGLALAPPPPLVGAEEKAAVLLAQEAELRAVLDGLQRVGRLKGCIEEPWPLLGGGWVGGGGLNAGGWMHARTCC